MAKEDNIRLMAERLGFRQVPDFGKQKVIYRLEKPGSKPLDMTEEELGNSQLFRGFMHARQNHPSEEIADSGGRRFPTLYDALLGATLQPGQYSRKPLDEVVANAQDEKEGFAEVFGQMQKVLGMAADEVRRQTHRKAPTLVFIGKFEHSEADLYRRGYEAGIAVIGN